MKIEYYIRAKDLEEHTQIHYHDSVIKDKRPTSVYNIKKSGVLVTFNAVGIHYRCAAFYNTKFELVDENLDTIDRSGIPVSIPNTKRTKGRSVD